MPTTSLRQAKPNLRRFVDAQADIYNSALTELEQGKKIGHWMWFIFPQMKGLGSSTVNKYFGIQSREEAKEYLAHPILGERLLECVDILMSVSGVAAVDIFGYPDVLKLRSSMTLFESVSSGESVFFQVLKEYYQGQRDSRTLELLDFYENNE